MVPSFLGEAISIAIRNRLNPKVQELIASPPSGMEEQGGSTNIFQGGSWQGVFPRCGNFIIRLFLLPSTTRLDRPRRMTREMRTRVSILGLLRSQQDGRRCLQAYSFGVQHSRNMANPYRSGECLKKACQRACLLDSPCVPSGSDNAPLATRKEFMNTLRKNCPRR